jgi:flagellar hook-basal body complex protein FliE
VTEAFLRGEPVELHEVMAATEEAGIALEMLIEIRNKVTDAYRTIINMQS